MTNTTNILNKKIENLIIYIYDKIINHIKHTMNNPDACASALDKDVDATITALNSKELITKVTKKKLEALLNEERNNVTTTLKSLGSIQQMLKLMEKREMNDGWWINIVKLLRHNERTRTITARVKLASIKAIINKIRNMYNLVWTQTSPSLLEDNIKKWKLILDKVKEYIDKNDKRQSEHDETKEIRKQAKWINTQKRSYKYKNRNMKYEIYRKLWKDFITDNKYKKHFLSTEEELVIRLEWVKKYINEYKKRPSSVDKNEEYKKYGNWICHQLQNYKNQQKNMSNNTIRKLWEDFINEYEDYL